MEGLFFFEKKNQKTFASHEAHDLPPARAVVILHAPKQTKVFCFFFTKKKNLP